jgi:DNA-binding transcriptional MerR regulator
VPDIFTLAAAAKFLGVSERQVRGWERLGRLRMLPTVGGVKLYLRDDLAALKQELAS